jgi:hypothetical protein
MGVEVRVALPGLRYVRVVLVRARTVVDVTLVIDSVGVVECGSFGIVYVRRRLDLFVLRIDVHLLRLVFRLVTFTSMFVVRHCDGIVLRVSNESVDGCLNVWIHRLESVFENVGRDVWVEELRSGRCSSKMGIIADDPLFPSHIIHVVSMTVRPIGEVIGHGVSCVLIVCLSSTLMVRYDCLYRWQDSDCAAGEPVDHGVIREYADTVSDSAQISLCNGSCTTKVVQMRVKRNEARRRRKPWVLRRSAHTATWARPAPSTSLYAETGFYPLWRSIFRWSGDVSGTASACVNDGLSSFSVP